MKALALVAVVVVLGCGGTGSSTRSSSSSDLITAEEIKAIAAENAFEVVQKLRPMFFTTRGRQSIFLTQANDPIVYLNGMRYGDLQSLKTIRAESIKEIKLIRPSDVSVMYGPDHNGGIIAVKTMGQ